MEQSVQTQNDLKDLDYKQVSVMQRTVSFEKTLMLGKIEGGRRRG